MNFDFVKTGAKVILGFTILISMIILFAGLFSACNKQILDLTYEFNYAYVKLQDGTVIQGEVSSWRDYEDGDQLQITFENGDTYLVHSCNATLIKRR